MPARPKFIPILTKDGWMVSIPANMSATGKRVRRFFENEQDAKKFAAAKRQKYHDGERGGIIPHDLAVMAGVAAEMLESHGVTILEAAKAFVARIEAGQSPETFQARYDRALASGEGL